MLEICTVNKHGGPQFKKIATVRLTHLLGVGGGPVATCMGMPVRAIPRMLLVVVVGGPLSHRYVDGRSGGLGASRRGSVLLLPGEGLELREGDDGRRSGDTRRLRSGMKQSGPGLLLPILKRVSPLGVGRERGLGQVTGIELGRGGLDWSGASLARLTGAACDGMRLLAQALRRCLGHVCLRTVIRIGQSSRIGSRSLTGHRLAPERRRPGVGVARGFRPGGGLATRRPSDVSLTALPLCVAFRLKLRYTASVRARKVSRTAPRPSVRYRRIVSAPGSGLALRSGLGPVWRPYLSYGRMGRVVCVVGGVIGRRPSSLRRAAGIRRRPSEEIPRVSIGPPVRLRLLLVCLRVGVPLGAVIPVRVCVSSREESRLTLIPCVHVTRIGRPALHSGIRLPRLPPVLLACVVKWK